MGMFMASVSFRCADTEKWTQLKPWIERMFQQIPDLVTNFDDPGPGYVILDMRGYQVRELADLPERISALTGDYAVMAVCNDSDFNLMSLYHNGTCLESSFIGEVYEEYEEFPELAIPDVKLWKPLLLDESQEDALHQALYGHEIFAEDNLRALTELTGLPIFDDELFMKYI